MNMSYNQMPGKFIASYILKADENENFSNNRVET